MLMVPRNNAIEPRPDICYFAMLAEPNREMTAHANLMIRRVPFYLPTIFRIARVSQRLIAMGINRPDVPMALFPRVLFIAEDVIDRSLQLIRTSPGMMTHPFMKFGEHFAVLRPIGMEAIQAIEASERAKYFSKKNRLGAPGWMPEIGEKVRFLLDDVFGGQEATVSEIDDKGRITLLHELMKRTVRQTHVSANRIGPV